MCLQLNTLLLENKTKIESNHVQVVHQLFKSIRVNSLVPPLLRKKWALYPTKCSFLNSSKYETSWLTIRRCTWPHEENKGQVLRWKLGSLPQWNSKWLVPITMQFPSLQRDVTSEANIAESFKRIIIIVKLCWGQATCFTFWGNGHFYDSLYLKSDVQVYSNADGSGFWEASTPFTSNIIFETHGR
jgi:hypothetical protein